MVRTKKTAYFVEERMNHEKNGHVCSSVVFQALGLNDYAVHKQSSVQPTTSCTLHSENNFWKVVRIVFAIPMKKYDLPLFLVFETFRSSLYIMYGSKSFSNDQRFTAQKHKLQLYMTVLLRTLRG